MGKKKLSDMNIAERKTFAADIMKKVAGEVADKEIEAERLRKELLGIETGTKVSSKNYDFQLPKHPENREYAKEVLERIGKSRYSGKRGQYRVFTQEYWTNWYAELRYPEHYVSWIDSIIIRSDGSVNIRFLRGKKDISNRQKIKTLDEEAQQIFEELREKLS